MPLLPETGPIRETLGITPIAERWNGKTYYYWLDCPTHGTQNVPAKGTHGVYDNRGRLKGHAGKCPQCKQESPVRIIRDTHKTSLFTEKPRAECGPKCMSAKGPSCDCHCKGANHGA